MVTSDFRQEVEIWPFRACAVHPAIIIGTVRSLWNWLWSRYYFPQNVFLVILCFSSWSLSCLVKSLVTVTVLVHRHIPMKLGLSDFSGYSPPTNQDYLGPTFMYIGFIPADADHIDHGVEVYTMCVSTVANFFKSNV